MKEKKDHHFIKKPIYEGGNKAFRDFIYGELKYPEEALKNKVEGVVLLRYEIDYKGIINNIKVKKGIGYGCDEEAKRIIKLLKFKIPKEPYKLKISFNKETKIQFKLPKKKVVTKAKLSESQVQYFISPKDNIIKPAEKKKTKKAYTYTVKW